MRGLFITGVGTEVGKTYVACLIARQLRESGLRVGVYKPAASGCLPSADGLESEDAVALWEVAGRPLSLDAVCPQRFAAPLAPHLAAREESKRIDPELLRRGLDPWLEASDVVLVEGAGGLMSPLSDEDYNLDLALELGLPAVVVAANRLGAINDTLQTLITAGANELSVAGVVLNEIAPATDQSGETNAEEIAVRADAPLLCRVAWQGDFDREVDWQALARASSLT